MAKSRLGIAVLLGVFGCGGGDDPATGTGGSGTANSGTGGSSTGGDGGADDGGAGGAGTSGSGAASSGAGGDGPSGFTLSVSVDGPGRVTSTPAGINCGSTCEATFPAGTEVTLQISEEGGALSAWDEACSGRAACALTLDADAQVGATFEAFEVGANAHGVAVTPDGAQALVTLGESVGLLQVLELSDGSISDSITVGTFPGAVAVTPDGSRAAVNNLNTVSIVTLSTGAVAPVASPCASDTLYDIAMTPDSTRAVTTMFNGSCVTNSVAVIDLAGASVENLFPITGILAAGVALDGAGSVLVARGIVGTQVDRVALAGGAVTPIPSTSASFGIAVLPGGAEALIASGDGDTIKRVSLTSNSVTSSIDYASNQDPHNLAISPDGQLAVVAGSFNVGVLSLASGTVLRTFDGGGRSVAITPDGKRALVTQGSTVRVYSLPPLPDAQ